MSFYYCFVTITITSQLFIKKEGFLQSVNLMDSTLSPFDSFDS